MLLSTALVHAEGARRAATDVGAADGYRMMGTR